MIKEKENQIWNFTPVDRRTTASGGEDSSFDLFKYGSHRYLVREYIQNSMDAVVNNSTPTVVKIESVDINTDEYPALTEKLYDHIEACAVHSDSNMHSRNPYKKKVEYLKKCLETKVLPCIKISDYNTTGMDYKDPEIEQSAFNAGVKEIRSSHKVGEHAGGSHGLGKTVGFVISEINAVYYSTMVNNPEHTCWGNGVVKLCTHKLGTTTFNGDAYYDKNEGYTPDDKYNIPKDFLRNEPGTDVFILGSTLTTENIETIRQEILRSFFKALSSNKLIVYVENELFCMDNLEEKMTSLFPDDENICYDVKRKGTKEELPSVYCPRPYYINCIKEWKDDDYHKEYIASASDYPHIEHAVLRFYINPEIKSHSEDRIICMRDKEMFICFHRMNSYKGFYGLFLCDGKGSETLRLMENATHEKWDVKETKDLPEEEDAIEIRKEINAFIRKSIEDAFPENEDDEHNISSLKNYVIGSGTNVQSKSGAVKSANSKGSPAGMSTEVKEFKENRVSAQFQAKLVVHKKRGKKKEKERNGKGELSSIQVPVPTTPTHESKDIPPKPTPPIPPVPSPDSEDKTVKPDTGDTRGFEGRESQQGQYKSRKGGKHAQDITAAFRLRTLIGDYGLLHRVIIDSPHKYEECMMVVKIAGEEKSSSIGIRSVNPTCTITGKDKNVLVGLKLYPGKNTFDILFEDNEVHSLEIKAYENQ